MIETGGGRARASNETDRRRHVVIRYSAKETSGTREDRQDYLDACAAADAIEEALETGGNHTFRRLR